mgnify:FL=1
MQPCLTRNVVETRYLIDWLLSVAISLDVAPLSFGLPFAFPLDAHVHG